MGMMLDIPPAKAMRVVTKMDIALASQTDTTMVRAMDTVRVTRLASTMPARSWPISTTHLLTPSLLAACTAAELDGRLRVRESKGNRLGEHGGGRRVPQSGAARRHDAPHRSKYTGHS